MSREDHELIAQNASTYQLEAADFIEVPENGHTFQVTSEVSRHAFRGKEAPSHRKVAETSSWDWVNR